MRRFTGLAFLAGFGFAGGLPQAEARILNFNQESFAPYIRIGQQQASGFAKTPFGDSSGAGNSFSKEYSTSANYEFGLVYSASQVTFRFGFEVLKPTAIPDIVATNASGTELYTVDNDVTGYAPKIGIDLNVKQWPQSRIFLAASFGMPTVTVQNSYGFTAAGTTQYSLANFREEIKGSGTLAEYAIGYEFLGFDTTTLILDVGYRRLTVDSFSHNVAVSNFQGSVLKGDPAYTNTGEARKLDLSGFFASISFRFWVF